MKTKYLVGLQVLLLLGAVVAGLMLKGNLADGPRMAHRFFGTFAGLISLMVVGVLAGNKAPKPQVAFAAVATLLSIIAGVAGKSLKTTSNYSLHFNVMRVSGVIALLCAIALLSLVIRVVKPAKN